MNIQELRTLYARHPKLRTLAKTLGDDSEKSIFLEGLLASGAPMAFSALADLPAMQGKGERPVLFILQDSDEAGYFYHDLTQLMGEQRVLFFPSSYRRAIKYAQRDPASEILRTETLARLSNSHDTLLYIVSYPDAVAELVVSKTKLDQRTLVLEQDQTVSMDSIEQTLRDFGFSEVDYVYEPGQFALRGSILDVYSYSCEYPFRIDFFGDDIDSIRTFEVEDQLSRDRRDKVEIVPELAGLTEAKEPLFDFLPAGTLIAMKDYVYVCDSVDRIYQEGFSSQAITERMEVATEMEQHEIEQQLRKESQLITANQFAEGSLRFRHIYFGHRPPATTGRLTTISFNITVQPLFHKNFELLMKSLADYREKGYTLYILADSQKQQERLKEILMTNTYSRGEAVGTPFVPVDHTLHEGFADNDLKVCLFTDHQIFDRFHKYNLKSDKARGGKMALTLKEIQQFEIGDYVVHVDHGVGRFGGLVRMPTPSRSGEAGGGYQEMIKITYQRGDAIYVSIHSLYKVAKYKSQDNGEPPRLSTLGTGQWERLKERTKNHIKDIARDLIKLYASRRRQKGFAFSPDGYMQHELEASFLYEDTPDQLKATQDVKADMEQARPMDRLVCGDVGFARPRWPCAQRSRRLATASRWPCWCRRRCWPTSTSTRSALD